MHVAEDVPHQNISYGVGLIVAAVFVISVQDVVFKLFSSELSLWQIFTLRGILALPVLFFFAWVRGVPHDTLKLAFGKWPLVRSFLITMTFLAFYAAIPFLSLSTVGAANYIAPIFITLISAYVINESVGFRGWIGVFLGFAGVITLLQPGTDAFSLWAVLPIFGAIFYAFSHITTRTKCQSVPLMAMALSLNLVMTIAGIIMSILFLLWQPNTELAVSYPYIFGAWSSVEFSDWLVLTLLAGFTIVIGMMLAGAYQAAPPSIIATFEYSYLVFVALWDILFFGISPNAASIVGMILIVGAGLMVLRRGPQRTIQD